VRSYVLLQSDGRINAVRGLTYTRANHFGMDELRVKLFRETNEVDTLIHVWKRHRKINLQVLS
jgi:hypothetical protein